ncbi:MAG: DUF433 domain-containing protein [Archangium sp.]
MSAAFIGSAEAAFIAEIEQRDLNRLVDEEVFADSWLVRRDDGRLFTRLAAALARFHFTTAEALSRAARLDVIHAVVTRIRSAKDPAPVVDLRSTTGIDWTWHSSFVTIDLRDALTATKERSMEIEDAKRLIVEDPDIMAGVPTFRGTRMPIDLAIGLDGEGLTEFRAAFPHITDAQLRAASVFSKVNPPRGRPVVTKSREPISTRRIELPRDKTRSR